MKIKAIAQLCKKAGMVYLYEDKNHLQWVGDGCAIYPLFDLPPMNKDSLFTIFNIPEKQRGKIIFDNGFTPTGVCLDDVAYGETMLCDGDMRIISGGRTLIPLRTQMGLIFINEKYLSPVSDIPETMELFERVSADGRQYIAIKSGMYIYGVVLPVDVINDDFVKEMDSLTAQCRIALDNKKSQNDDKFIRFQISGEREDKGGGDTEK